ncbi:MAG TPA: NADH-quinone oxidoreductase subunit M [Candidatus Solibacter sp.]|nr:NADH-quinone oxidoreductase subunit M [Candidatus Solibacter sp.]
MILILLVAILLLGGILAGISARSSTQLPRWIALAAIAVDLALAAGLWTGRPTNAPAACYDEVNFSWVPNFGIHFHLAIDGLSFLMLVLTLFLGIVAVLCSWTEIREKIGFFHFNLMWVLAGIVSVFLAVDLFLFYFAWELMLIPMYFLIVIWGHERRVYAATKFFLFTQCSGLLMLIAILALYFMHHQVTGVYTFEYSELLGTALGRGAERAIMLGFFVAFAVKLPVFPFHTWLPDAHTEAPTAGSVILAGLLLKTGGYGMLRFVVPLFPARRMNSLPSHWRSR